MGFKEDIQLLIQQSLPSFGNIQVGQTYVDSDGSARTYDPLTDTYTGGPVNHPNTKMIFVGYEAKDTDGTVIRRNDKKAIIAKLDLTPTPAEDDKILADGQEWIVKNVKTDPANAAWVLQIRLTGDQ